MHLTLCLYLFFSHAVLTLYLWPPSASFIYMARGSFQPPAQPFLFQADVGLGSSLFPGASGWGEQRRHLGTNQSALWIYGEPQADHPRPSQLFRQWKETIRGLEGAVLEESEIRGRAELSVQVTTYHCAGDTSTVTGASFTSYTLWICKWIVAVSWQSVVLY